MSSPEPRDRYEADPVPLGPKGWGAARTFTVVTAAAVALIVAIAKPWAGGASEAASVADASPSASASAVSSRSSLTSPDVGAQATPSPPASRPEGGATGILAGTWGIATLGPTSPGSEAAAIWSPVAPRSVDASSRPPQCSLADLHASGSVVAITVPPALRSAWSVRVVTGGPDGRPFSIATRRVPLPQATASSVAYLARADGKSWGSGALRFVVRWPGGSVALDTCFVGVPLAGSLPSIADALGVEPVSGSGPAPSDGRLWNGWEPGYP